MNETENLHKAVIAFEKAYEDACMASVRARRKAVESQDDADIAAALEADRAFHRAALAKSLADDKYRAAARKEIGQ